MSQRTIVVLGGALSGPTAAARAREMDDAARIVLLERNTRVSYALAGLAYHLSGEVPSVAALDRERADYFRAHYAIEVRTLTEAVHLDAANRQLTLQGGVQNEFLTYDALVVAMGAESLLPDVPGLAGANVCSFRTLDDLEALDGVLRAGGRRVAVLGGGAFGLEAVDGLVRGGADVTVIEQSDHLLPRFGRQVRAIARNSLQGKARVILGDQVVRAEGADGQVQRLLLRSGETLEVDAVVVTAGLRPRTQLLLQAGARLNPDGSVVVDDQCRTSLPDVYACGVCVAVPQTITGNSLWLPQGAIADKTAQVAGENAAGGQVRLMPVLGSMLLRLPDVTLGRTGLTEDEAHRHLGGQAVKRTTVHAPSHEAYFPGSETLTLELLWEKATGRVLGVEAIGKRGVDKRLDAAACAIAGGLSVEQLAQLDLTFAPPFGAARDPLNVAATVAASERRGLGTSLTPNELQPRLGEVQVLDVRDQTGWPESIPGSKRMSLSSLRDHLGELDSQRPVVAVSTHGKEGWLASRILAQKGFSQVAHLSGGLWSWSLEATPQ